MSAISSSALFAELKKLIVLPENVIALDLRLAVDTQALLTLTTGVTVHGPADGTGIAAPGKSKQYRLVEVTP